VPKAASNALRIAVSLGLSALLLWLFFRKLDISELGTTLSAAHPGWVGLALTITLVNFPLRSWRWTRLLHHVQRVPQREAFSATCIGFAASVLLPARAGEIVRPAVLSRRTGLPFAPALASIAVERLIDLVSVVLLFVAYALGGWEPANLAPEAHGRLEILRRSAFLVGAATVLVFAGLALLAARPQLAERVLGPLERRLPAKIAGRVVSLLRSFLGGLASIRTGSDAAVMAGSSAAMWLLNALQFHAVTRAFDIVLPYPVSFFVLTWAVLGLAIPTPGGVGGYHTAVAYSLTGFYGVAASPAAATALVTHAVAFVPVTLAGVAFLAGSGLTLRRLAASGGGPSSGEGGSSLPA
jgi:uncharacterized protein (TIRG00374 family)